MSVRFTQCCPTCGRRVQFRATLLGRVVACQHCHAEFIAQTDSDRTAPASRVDPSHEADPLMARVDALLSKRIDDPAIR